MIGILIISIVIGIIYIAMGFLVKKEPTMISGYNRLDEIQQKTFPNRLKKSLIITGIVTMLGCVICTVFKWNTMAVSFLILPTMIMVLVVISKEKQSNNNIIVKFVFVFFLLLTILTPFFFILSSKESSILFESENIKITGLYGERIPFNYITGVTLINNIPSIQLRTNGFALGAVRKGYFLMEGMGTVKLFLSSTSPPYIKIQTVDNRSIIINFKDADKTTDIYNKINAHIQKEL